MRFLAEHGQSRAAAICGGEKSRTNPAAASRLGGAGFVFTADCSDGG